MSHYRAGTGAVFVATREERRFVASLLAELPPGTPVRSTAGSSGPIRDVRTGREEGQGLVDAYRWASNGPGRVLVVYDYQRLVNNPGHWRTLIEVLPDLRCPPAAGPNDPASLVVFVAPCWDFHPDNPIRGMLPVLEFAAPTRAELAKVVKDLAGVDDAAANQAAAAVCGLPAEVAEQAIAECLAANRGQLVDSHLRSTRKRELREAGLEIWEPAPNLGGLDGFKAFVEQEFVPWLGDELLAVRRILCAGVPGVGKSYCARWLAAQVGGCEVARLSVPNLKASLVGQSEANLRRALRAVEVLGHEAPLILVIDEIDAAVQRNGLDSGVSSGLFTELLTWLQSNREQPGQKVVVVGTLNHLDRLDAALESRFDAAARFFFDLPNEVERKEVAEVHLRRLRCDVPAEEVAGWIAAATPDFSSREIAEAVVPSVLRRSQRRPTRDVVAEVVAATTPAARTQAEQLAKMRQAAATLRRANSSANATGATMPRRRIGM